MDCSEFFPTLQVEHLYGTGTLLSNAEGEMISLTDADTLGCRSDGEPIKITRRKTLTRQSAI